MGAGGKPRERRTGFPHHQVVATVIFYGQEDLGDHDQDTAFRRWVDGPGALRVGGVVPRVVWGFNIPCEIPQLPSTLPV